MVSHFDHILNFMQFGELLKGNKLERVGYLIWFAAIWSIWLPRNYIVFKATWADCDKIVSHIKMLSWGSLFQRLRRVFLYILRLVF